MAGIIDVLGLLLALFLVFMNAFFVVAEFAFVRIRPTRVEKLVKEGRTSADLVKEATDKLDDYLAVCQLGITIASLGLGRIGEPAIAALISPVLGTFLPETAIEGVSFIIGFLAITLLHVTFGELAPKTLSVQDAERMSLIVAPPMKFFYYIFMPAMIVLNGAANAFTRLLGYPPASEAEEVHTEEDIRSLIAQSKDQGHVEANEEEMIEAVFDLDETVAREIMIPRPDVVTLPADLPLSELLTTAAETSYNSYPVLEGGDDEKIAGAVHIEAVVRAVEADRDGTGSLTARDLAREMLIVPETRPVDEILTEFQKQEIQMAAVIDEWGSFEGIVSVEDIIEEIVGDIQDEFDNDEPTINRLDNGMYSIDGRVPIRTANETLDTAFDHDEFETVGGLVLDEVGRAPEVGDRVQVDEYAMRVKAVDGTRIDTIVARETERDENNPESEADTEEDQQGGSTENTTQETESAGNGSHE